MSDITNPPSKGSQHINQTPTFADSGSALVTDSSLRTALLTIRCLGRHGVRITATERPGRRRSDLGGLSRYVSRREVVPDNRTDPAGYAQALLDLAEGHDVLVPIGMHSIIPVAERAAAFDARIRTLLPPIETIERADNTRLLLRLARSLDIPVPASYEVADHPSVEALAGVVRYPVIVKAGVETGLPPSARYDIVADAAALVASVKRLAPYTAEPLIQELVPGEGIGYEALLDRDHTIVAEFTHRRLREYPLSGGPSTYCESCHAPAARAYGQRLLTALQWTGLAMVEFKLDAAGNPVLMEINPRPWGSMQLPIRAGIEFPWLAFNVARGAAVTPRTEWPDGVRLRYFVNDLQAVAATLRQRRGWRQRAAAVASILDPRVKEGVLSWRDPRPSIAYLVKAFTRAAGG